MSLEKEPARFSNGSGRNLPPPPGFASLTSFRMKRVGTADETENSKDLSSKDNDVSQRCLRRRPWILFDQGNHERDKSDSKLPEKDFPSRMCLPKGVIHGCADCSNCLKVKARWRPEDGSKDVVKDAPVYYPNEEQFKDPIKYISEIRKTALQYGICRIVPPPSWNPPCVVQNKRIWEGARFVTQVQRIDGIQVPYSNSETDHSVEDKAPKKRRKTQGTGFDFGHPLNYGTRVDTQHMESRRGPEFTMETFKKYADDFKGQYFCKSDIPNSNNSSTLSKGKWEPSLMDVEGEYKRIIDRPTEEIEVLCCDGSESRIFGSEFPTMSVSSYPVGSVWNLNKISTLRGSLLSSESTLTSNVMVPRIHLGMCFSTLHWRTEEHHLYALCYMHLGARKIWYGIPPRGSSMFQEDLKNNFAAFDKQHRLVKHISPSALTSRGIPVFRCVQSPREFVLVFPGVYHSGFDSGFNLSETANFAPLDWLPHGQNAVELYRDLGLKTSLSHDKILLQAAFVAITAQWEISFCSKSTPDNLFWKACCGKEGILTEAIKLRVKCEETERKFMCSSSIRLMAEEFDATTKRECKICNYDLHFSAAGCSCSPSIYSCLKHAEQLCHSCNWTNKFFLFRRDMSNLNLLVEALEGKLTSVFKYSKLMIGLSLRSIGNKSSPVQEVRADTPLETGRKSQSGLILNTRFREEIKARLRAVVLKKTVLNDKAADKSPTSIPVVSLGSVVSSGSKPLETTNQADVVTSAKNKCHFPQMELAVDSSTSSEESDEDPDFVIKS